MLLIATYHEIDTLPTIWMEDSTEVTSYYIEFFKSGRVNWVEHTLTTTTDLGFTRITKDISLDTLSK